VTDQTPNDETPHDSTRHLPDVVESGEVVHDAEPAEPMADLSSLLGGFDIGSLLGAAQSMQEQFAQAQREAAETVLEGQSGGGVVKISATGQLHFQSVHISPDAFDPEDPTMLEDLVLAALHDLIAQVNLLSSQANPMGGLDLGAIDLGGLGGLLGGT